MATDVVKYGTSGQMRSVFFVTLLFFRISGAFLLSSVVIFAPLPIILVQSHLKTLPEISKPQISNKQI